MESAQPFRFSASLYLTLATNRQAHDAAELLQHVREASGATRHLREYLLLFLYLEHRDEHVVHLS
jgi:hypothetical protein